MAATYPNMPNITNGKPKVVWRPWFAWRPVRVHGRWRWLTTVWRKVGNTYVDHDDWRWYHYGTEFDALRDNGR